MRNIQQIISIYKHNIFARIVYQLRAFRLKTFASLTSIGKMQSNTTFNIFITKNKTTKVNLHSGLPHVQKRCSTTQ